MPRKQGRCDLLGCLAEEDRKLASSYKTVHGKGTCTPWLMKKRYTCLVSWDDLWRFQFYKQNIVTKRMHASLFQFCSPHVYKSCNSVRVPSSKFTSLSLVLWFSKPQNSFLSLATRFTNCLQGIQMENEPRRTAKPTFEAPRISRQSAHEGGKVCQPYAAAVFTPRKDFWYSFLLEAESTPGSYCDRKD